MVQLREPRLDRHRRVSEYEFQIPSRYCVRYRSAALKLGLRSALRYRALGCCDLLLQLSGLGGALFVRQGAGHQMLAHLLLRELIADRCRADQVLLAPNERRGLPKSSLPEFYPCSSSFKSCISLDGMLISLCGEEE